jgi:sensor c-di-GMP phosphodiesterase-like protein
MRKHIGFGLVALAALITFAAPSWLAFLEAHRQAYVATADQVHRYALDILHRVDETTTQASRAFRRLEQADFPPCSAGALALMRQIDLGSSYLQAVGYNRREATFSDGRQLVAIVRSRRTLVAAIAALPANLVERRADDIARRLVPAGAFGGLGLALAILLVARGQFSMEAAPDIVERLDGLLAHCGARPSNLIAEITERGVLNLDSARHALGALRACGIEVAIDDFGTGYSGLSHLESLELDSLKIDRSFIEAIGTGAPISQVISHIVAMARSMGLPMIAEGIESQAQADFLRERGVDFAQGFLFGRPMPFAELVQHFNAREQAARQAGGVTAGLS